MQSACPIDALHLAFVCLSVLEFDATWISQPHVRTTGRITAALNAAARGVGCRLYSSATYLRSEGSRNYFSGGVLVSCGPDHAHDDFEHDDFESEPQVANVSAGRAR
ncbi:hypothetical protein [Deinococcus frigens]|uniref:hypothetical protein n=1 Tax=Deinococcus frigens TaxID=249403 RepID=UPI0004955B91|nr:hypothetical protein [Deinococcus frigens]